MKSQEAIDREKRLKTALGLANRAMRPGSPAEGKACEALLEKHMKKYKITDADLTEYARKESKGGRKHQDGQQQGGGAQKEGFYYRDQRDRQREAEEAEWQRRQQEQARRQAADRQERQERDARMKEQRDRAAGEWNAEFERKYGRSTRSGWNFERNVSREKTFGEKAVKFIDSLFGL